MNAPLSPRHGSRVMWRSGCTCTPCGVGRERDSAWKAAHRRQVRADVAAGRREVTSHGVTGYAQGCGCDVCCEANTARQRGCRAGRKARES